MNSIGQELVEYHFDDFKLVGLSESEEVVVPNEPTFDLSVSVASNTISNADLTTSLGYEANCSTITITATDLNEDVIPLKDLYDAEAIEFEIEDDNIAIVRGTYRKYYVFGISAGTTTVTVKVTYEDYTAEETFNITVEGSTVKDASFEGSTTWKDNSYWSVTTNQDSVDSQWGYDLNSSYGMTGGGNIFVRMPNGDDTAVVGWVRFSQDVTLEAGNYIFSVYLRRFPGYEQQDIITVDGVDYDSFDWPFSVGAVKVVGGDESLTDTWSTVFEGDNKKGVLGGEFEACSIEFTITEAGTYRLWFKAEAVDPVGMGAQIDNAILALANESMHHIVTSFNNNATEMTVSDNYQLATIAYNEEDEVFDMGENRPSYVSSNTEVLTVSSDGYITAVGVGEATIYTTLTVGAVTKEHSLLVTVNAAPIIDNPVDPGNGLPTWGILSIIGGGVVVLAGVAFILIKKGIIKF
jgi:hypothetical protein